MKRWISSLSVVVLGVVVLAGCQTMTGRTTGQYIDDKTTSAKVKTALAGVKMDTITRVDVDTVNSTVFLTGTVADPAIKGEILQVAHAAADGKPVIDNLTVANRTSAPVAASPTTTTGMGASPAAGRLMSDLKFSRLDPEVGTGRYVAFDSAGRRVATVVAVPASQLEQQGMPFVDTAGRPIQHVSIYPSPGSDGKHYHVVLWHVSRDEATRLQ